MSDDEYKKRERAMLQQLAWATLADPKASPDDKRAARRRLETPERVLDVTRLTNGELAMVARAQARSAGQPTPPVYAEDITAVEADLAQMRAELMTK